MRAYRTSTRVIGFAEDNVNQVNLTSVLEGPAEVLGIYRDDALDTTAVTATIVAGVRDIEIAHDILWHSAAFDPLSGDRVRHTAILEAGDSLAIVISQAGGVGANVRGFVVYRRRDTDDE